MKFMMTTYGDEDVYNQESFTDEQRDWLRGIVEFMNEFNAAARGAGELVPLPEQDRSLWDRSAIAEGVSLVSDAMSRSAIGP